MLYITSTKYFSNPAAVIGSQQLQRLSGLKERSWPGFWKWWDAMLILAEVDLKLSHGRRDAWLGGAIRHVADVWEKPFGGGETQEGKKTWGDQCIVLQTVLLPIQRFST